MLLLIVEWVGRAGRLAYFATAWPLATLRVGNGREGRWPLLPACRRLAYFATAWPWATDKEVDMMFRSTTMSVSTILGSWITSTNCLEIQVKVAVRQTYVSPDALGDCIPCGPAWVTLERRGTTNDACHICHTPPCAQARASWQLWARGRTSTCGSTCCVTTLAIMHVAGVPTKAAPLWPVRP